MQPCCGWGRARTIDLMRSDFVQPERECVHEANIMVNLETGEGIFRVQDRSFGESADGPHGWVLLVWVGLWVAYLSPHSHDIALAVQSRAVRRFFNDDAVAVLFAKPNKTGHEPEQVMSDITSPVDAATLARAVAFVAVEAAWNENPLIEVFVDGQLFVLKQHPWDPVTNRRVIECI